MFEVPKQGGPATHNLSSQPQLDEQLARQLRDHLQQLQLLLPVISTEVMALHHQNAELDSDIASVLDHHASSALDCEIDALRSLLATLACRNRLKEAAA